MNCFLCNNIFDCNNAISKKIIMFSYYTDTNNTCIADKDKSLVCQRCLNHIYLIDKRILDEDDHICKSIFTNIKNEKYMIICYSYC